MSRADHQSADAKTEDDFALLSSLLDQLPIWAIRIGYHSNSTDEQRKLADDLFAVFRVWIERRTGRSPNGETTTDAEGDAT